MWRKLRRFPLFLCPSFQGKREIGYGTVFEVLKRSIGIAMDEKLIFEENTIKVSNTAVYAEDRRFDLRKIRNICLRRKSPARRWAILCFILGIAGIVLGSLEFIESLEAGWRISMGPAGAHSGFMISGVVLMIAGVVLMITRKECYIISILTDNGEKEVLRTQNRDFAAKITGILMKVFHRFIPEAKLHRNKGSVLL